MPLGPLAILVFLVVLHAVGSLAFSHSLALNSGSGARLVHSVGGGAYGGCQGASACWGLEYVYAVVLCALEQV